MFRQFFTKYVDSTFSYFWYFRANEQLDEIKNITSEIQDIAFEQTNQINGLVEAIGNFHSRVQNDNLLITCLILAQGVEEFKLKENFIMDIASRGLETIIDDSDEENCVLTVVTAENDGGFDDVDEEHSQGK